MGKGEQQVNATIDLTLRTLGGLGQVRADVVVKEGHNQVDKYTIKMTPQLESRYTSEELFKEIYRELARVLKRYGTDHESVTQA